MEQIPAFWKSGNLIRLKADRFEFLGIKPGETTTLIQAIGPRGIIANPDNDKTDGAHYSFWEPALPITIWEE